MANFKKRIEKLEKLQPSGLVLLSDEELNTRISELSNKPEFHDWLADETDENLLRSRINELKAFHENEY